MTLNYQIRLVSLRLLTAFFTLGTFKKITGQLSLQEFSAYSIIQVFVLFHGLILINPIGQYMNRHISSWQEPNIFFLQFARFTIYVIVASFLASSFLVYWNNDDLGNDFLELFSSTFIFLVATTISSSLLGFSNILQIQYLPARISLISAGINFFLCSIFIDTGTQITTIFYLLSTGHLLISVSVTAILFNNNHFHFSDLNCVNKKIKFVTRQQIFDFILPLIAITIFIWFTISGYRLIIEKNQGLKTVGLITLTFGLAGQFWNLIESILNQNIQSKILTDSFLTSEDRSIQKLFKIFLPLYGIFMLSMLLFSEIIWTIIMPAKYFIHITLFKIGIVIETLRSLGSFLSNEGIIRNNMKILLIPFMSSSVILLIGLQIVPTLNWISPLLFFAHLSTNLFLIKQLKFRNIQFSKYALVQIAILATIICLEFSSNYKDKLGTKFFILKISELLIIGNYFFRHLLPQFIQKKTRC